MLNLLGIIDKEALVMQKNKAALTVTYFQRKPGIPSERLKLRREIFERFTKCRMHDRQFTIFFQQYADHVKPEACDKFPADQRVYLFHRCEAVHFADIRKELL